MKKFISIFLASLMIFSCFMNVYISVNAVELTDDSGDCGAAVTYNFDSATGTLSINGTGAMRNYADTLSMPWYDYKTAIKAVEIGESITSIGDYTFSGCWNLESVTISQSVTSIGKWAFFYCKKLENVELPVGITGIGSVAFADCDKLKSINIPESVTRIGNQAFSDCINLESIIIPDKITQLEASTFSGCGSLRSITIPSSVTTVGNSAFSNCSELSEVIISNGVKNLGSNSFSYCYGLSDITIPESVTSIGQDSFYSCDNLSEIHILNPDCKISNSSSTIYQNAVIYGYSGSTAENYADAYGREFVELECTHLWDDGIISKPSTCTSYGEILYSCTICDEVKREIIEKTEHNIVEANIIFASYFENGYTGDVLCSDCGEIFEEGELVNKLKLDVPMVEYKGGKKKITVNYKKVENSTGFQVKYTRKGNTSLKTYNVGKDVKKNIKKLKSGTYKVRVRAFVKNGNNIAYSKWSKAQKVKVK